MRALFLLLCLASCARSERIKCGELSYQELTPVRSIVQDAGSDKDAQAQLTMRASVVGQDAMLCSAQRVILETALAQKPDTEPSADAVEIIRRAQVFIKASGRKPEL